MEGKSEMTELKEQMAEMMKMMMKMQQENTTGNFSKTNPGAKTSPPPRQGSSSKQTTKEGKGKGSETKEQQHDGQDENMSQTEETDDENTEQPTDETNPNDDMNYRPPKDDKQPTGPQTGKETHAEAHYVSGESHKPPNKNNHNPRPYTPRPHYNQTQYQPNQQTPYQPIAYINHNRPPTQHNPTPHYNQPRPNQYPSQQNRPPNNSQTRPYQNFNRNQPRPFQPQRTFDPIPVTYAELFAHLQTERILTPIAGQTPNTTAPWYDPNANCDYHSGIIGHSTETCRALKHRIQDLIDSKWLEFKDAVPTITGNPLPNHGNQGINVLEQDDDMAVVEKVEDMKTPLKVIFKVLCQQGLVEMVGGVHMKMIDQKIQDRIITRKFVPVLNIPAETPSYTAPPRWVPRLYVESGATRHPGPFPYKSDKAVPWKYQGKSVAKSKQTEEVVNLAGVGNMSRSGRVYSPVDLSKKIINASKGKEKIVETSENRPELEVTELFPEKMEREVSEEEA
ncbi:hypothetical protein Lal_00044321 [Lupinus albus]|nr:hypothetical protein Lal_00044321 [Lupinus albus]